MSLTIGVPRETFAGEKRVATVPEVVEKLVKLGFGVAIERGAGASANFEDEAYQAAGARVVGGADELYGASDIVFKVRPPSADEVSGLKPGTTLIGFIWPAQNPELMQQLAAKQATVLAIDTVHHQAVWGHVGDTRLYLFRDGKVAVQTKDHSVVQKMVDAVAPAE